MPHLRKISILLCFFVAVSTVSAQTAEITVEDLRDKINGGLIGQFFGNLNGLEHENQYFEEPGDVVEYTPDLSDGAFTDDDTDIEFVYMYHMAQKGETILPYAQIRDLWTENINEHIWCANKYARNLMDIGFEPPYTGRIAFNPWSVFNISGQFLCEQFALISPGMPQTAVRLGTHYTHVAIDGEPTQTTQLFDTMISTAFFEDDYLEIIKNGLAALDPRSEIHEIVSDVIGWYLAHPDDWRATRSSIKNKYWEGTWGGPGGSNGYRTITAATIGALIHGQGDFVEAIRLAFNFGWDADNTAAMVGTIMGVLKGEKWIRSQGWVIKDEYRNTRRPGLPTNYTITDFADLHFKIAKGVIFDNGGVEIEMSGKTGYRIVLEDPANVELLPDPLHRIQEMRNQWWPIIQEELTGSTTERARAVYAAICLDLVKKITAHRSADWYTALETIKPYYDVLFGDEQWSEDAKEYFHDVVNNRNGAPDCPFGY